MILRAWCIGVLWFAVQAAIAQGLPLSQQLLQGEEKFVPDSIAPTPSEEVPQAIVVEEAIDSSAVDYVPPDAAAPGTSREEDGMMDRRSRQNTRSGARIGIGIPLGLFNGIWISF